MFGKKQSFKPRVRFGGNKENNTTTDSAGVASSTTTTTTATTKARGSRRTSAPRNGKSSKPRTSSGSLQSLKKTPTAPVSIVSTTPVHGFSDAEIAEFKESFTLFDVEGKGQISVADLRSVLESLAEHDEDTSSFPHLDKLLDGLSQRSDDENMHFDDYLRLMESTTLQESLNGDGDDSSGNFLHVFQLFDADGKGYITVEDLERIAFELGEYDMAKAELEEMIERANPKHRGKVTLKEFSTIMTMNLFQKAEEGMSSHRSAT